MLRKNKTEIPRGSPWQSRYQLIALPLGRQQSQRHTGKEYAFQGHRRRSDAALPGSVTQRVFARCPGQPGSALEERQLFCCSCSPARFSLSARSHVLGEARSPSSRQMGSGGGAEPGPVSPRAGSPWALGVISAGTPTLSTPVETNPELKAELFLSLPKDRACSCRKVRACSPCCLPGPRSLASVNFGLR